MCGICGTAGFANRSQLEAMNSAIRHRGPDDSGVFIDGVGDGRTCIGLGNRRLSIIDLSSAGHQPMCNEHGSIWITYNGEVYNFLDLRTGLERKGHRFRSNTDTEVLIHLYEEKGVGFLNELNGMFALALWDKNNQTLLLARDPFGIKPLYYIVMPDGCLIFGSEIKSFLVGGLLRPEVDLEALHDYLNFLWVPGPKTMFKGVYKLSPGHYLLWENRHIKINKYWFGEPGLSTEIRSEAELVEELRTLLSRSIKRHLISDVPLGVFLSGGIDSSSILALSTQISNHSMKAYTISFRSEDASLEQSDEDPKFARLVANEFGSDHFEIKIAPDIVELLPKVVWHLDEPVADPASITSYLICKAAREQLTVLLSGQGGDEIFAGYRAHLSDPISRLLGFIPNPIRKGVLLPGWNLLPNLKDWIPGVRPGKVLAYHRYFEKIMRGIDYPRQTRYVFCRSYYAPGEQLKLYSSALRSEVKHRDPYETHTAYFKGITKVDFLDQMLYVDQKTFLPELNLTYSDKMSMAASVEARVPLLDQELVRFMRKVPAKFKIKGLKQKYLFKKAMEGILPQSVIWRGKAGFGAPIRRWLDIDLAEMVRDYLSPETIRKRGLFNARAVRELIDEDRSKQQDNTYKIWALLTLEIWLRVFVEQSEAYNFSNVRTFEQKYETTNTKPAYR